jgi:hypothetical protein
MKQIILIIIIFGIFVGTALAGPPVPPFSLPDQTSNSGKYLTTNGSVESWGTVSGVIASSVTVSDNSTDTTEFVALFGAATGDLGPRTRSTLTHNAATGLLSSTLFGGALNGTVGATTPATGAFTTLSTSGVATIPTWSLPTGTTLRTVASSTTPDLGNATSEYVEISGAVTITGFASARIGTVKFLRFTGAPQLTHNGTSFILPASRNINVAAGDRAIFTSLGSGNWQCHELLKANGRVLGDQIYVSHSTSENANAWDMYGQIHLINGAYTLTVPAQVIGMNGRVRCTTAATCCVDVNASDHHILMGTSLTNGNKICSDGYAGSEIQLDAPIANTWIDSNGNGLWIDSGA